MSTERSQQEGVDVRERDDDHPAGDSAGTYFISVEDFEARKPPRKRAAKEKASSGAETPRKP